MSPGTKCEILGFMGFADGDGSSSFQSVAVNNPSRKITDSDERSSR